MEKTLINSYSRHANTYYSHVSKMGEDFEISDRGAGARRPRFLTYSIIPRGVCHIGL